MNIHIICYVHILIICLLIYRSFTKPDLWVDTLCIITFILFLLGIVNIEPLQISTEIHSNNLGSQSQKTVIKGVTSSGDIEITGHLSENVAVS